jgi:hypothetical protein
MVLRLWVSTKRATAMAIKNKTIKAVIRSEKEIQKGFSASSLARRRRGVCNMNTQA